MRILISISASAILALILFCSKKSDSGSASQEMTAAAIRGRELFFQNGCDSCHGKNGGGDGPAGSALDPPPRNFRKIGDYKQGSNLESITKTIMTGIPGTMMVANPLPEEDRKMIAEYILYLQKN